MAQGSRLKLFSLKLCGQPPQRVVNYKVTSSLPRSRARTGSVR